ncbi:hypothetical protein MMC07_002757 [Pseudocyphellaria aurata]|nr:hypothetical protein [Pseudocyphellaria aurata]
MAPSAISSPASRNDESSIALSPLYISSASNPEFEGYDHVTWVVGNAKQAASYYVTRMGFELVAYRGLETGSRCIASWVVSNGRATFVLTSSIRGAGYRAEGMPEAEEQEIGEIHQHLATHGDAVKDVAFKVDDARALYYSAVARGATSVQEPRSVYDNRDGEIVTAAIKTYGDTTHTFIERSRYHGIFMPGFRAVTKRDPLADHLPTVPLEAIDHCVGNQDWDGMESACA